MQIVIMFICLAVMLIASVAAAMLWSRITAAMCLALASVSLAVILFLLHAPWAALFELSVCAGLVTVIFASTISMTREYRQPDSTPSEYHVRFSPLPFILIFVGVVLAAIVLTSGFDVNLPATDPSGTVDTFKEVFWNTRQADILGQIIIILAGAFAVAILFKESTKE